MSADQSGLSGLQFDRAEPLRSTEPVCIACGSPIVDRYYALNGRTLCPSCADAQSHVVEEPSTSDYIRAAAYGAGAALAGTFVYFAILALSGYEIGWIAVAVGWLVGKAVHKGSRGIGGRKLQIMAVVLTYFSIVGSYVPLMIKSAIDNPPGQKQSAGAGAKQNNAGTPEVAEPEKSSAAALFVGIAMLFGYILVLPFMQGLSSILGLFIIFIGLFEAWKLNRRVPMVLEGPFQVTPSEPAA
jgi:hypothetical protein